MNNKDSIYIYKVKSPVYLRDSSSTQSKALTTLNKGDILEVKDSINNWYSVTLNENGLSGFVGKTYIEKDNQSFFNLTFKKDYILPSLLILIVSYFIIRYIKRKINLKRYVELIESVTSFDRGTPSEKHLISILLKNGISPDIIFHDLCVEINEGEYSQIDLVLTTTEGVIVVEVKDFSGWIYGSGSKSNWTKVLAYGKKKYRFYNPIKQNKSHIQHLRKKLNQPLKVPFFSVIVFYGDCELKEINYVPKDTFLVKPHRILEVLEFIKENNDPAPYKNKHSILENLNKAVMLGNDVNIKKKHIENINDMLGKNRIYD